MVNLYEKDVLDFFVYYPMRQFGVRELGRLVNMNTKTVMKYLKGLIKKNIVVKIKKPHSFVSYEANRLSRSYKLIKSNLIINKIAEIELIDFLEQKLHPTAIVLFGSVQKGTYTKESDIDLFIQGDDKSLDLLKFEKILCHKIQLFFSKDLNKLSSGLRNNIINGYTLSGALEI
ncbi:nucleotidyltransferase domain-containing protein [archaeon]|nr:nucleotidyltransferase domain-containing protein [archaeon]